MVPIASLLRASPSSIYHLNSKLLIIPEFLSSATHHEKPYQCYRRKLFCINVSKSQVAASSFGAEDLVPPLSATLAHEWANFRAREDERGASMRYRGKMNARPESLMKQNRALLLISSTGRLFHNEKGWEE